jgi:soluble lytic murein transglycosylase
MHNDGKRKGVRLALAFLLLFGGVVFDAASGGSAGWGIPLPPKKPAVTQMTLGTHAADDEMSTSRKKTSSAEDLPGDAGSGAFRLIQKTIRAELKESRPTYALKLLEKDPLAKKLKASEYDRLQALIAQSYLSEGKIEKAGELARKAASRSGTAAPLAGWVAGLADWRLENYDRAAEMFGVTANSRQASEWLSSGAAFWAARSAIKADKSQREIDSWLEKAAQHPRTFYGVIALRMLDEDFDLNWETPDLDRSDRKKLELNSAVVEAMRLASSGKVGAAVDRLGKGGLLKSRESREKVLALMLDANQPALALYLARKTTDAKGRYYDAALYPVSPWEPRAGYEVDEALVLALIRQESRFNPYAVSSTGARGLMQLLPSTARFVAGVSESDLSKPEINVDAGQKYVRHLLRDSNVNSDLFRMAVAYNAGPGKLARWKRELGGMDDPLLFIESIPSPETRAFVERVMVNYWIYRNRMGQDAPSLDAVASYDQPSYAMSLPTERRSDQVALATAK